MNPFLSLRRHAGGCALFSAILLGLGSAGLEASTELSSPPVARPAGSASGISYRNEKIPDKPLSIHVVKIDRSRPDLVLATTLAKGTVLDLGTLSEQVKALQATNLRPQVAINGDFYRVEREPYAGDPAGFQLMNGELISSPHTNQTCFWLDRENQPHLSNLESLFQARFADGTSVPFDLNEERLRGTARVYTPRLGASTQTSGGREIVLEAVDETRWLPLKSGANYTGRVREVREDGNTPLQSGVVVLSLDRELLSKVPTVKRGDLINLSTFTAPNTEGSEVAIGGGPALVRDGKVANYKGRNDRHPRSAFGWNDSHWFMVTVDGRQSNLSIGMTIPELSEYLVKLGVKEELNLDGGGSATLWLFGNVVNSPCYGYERSTANGLVFLKKDKDAGRREPD